MIRDERTALRDAAEDPWRTSPRRPSFGIRVARVLVLIVALVFADGMMTGGEVRDTLMIQAQDVARLIWHRFTRLHFV